MTQALKTKVPITGAGAGAVRVWLTGLLGVAVLAAASPAMACRDIVGRPPPPILTLEDQDARYLRQDAVVAVASIVAQGEERWTFRVDGPATGDFAAEVTLEDEVLIGCRITPLPILPKEGAVGNRVLLVRSDANNIQYAVLLDTPRGHRLWARASVRDEVNQ